MSADSHPDSPPRKRQRQESSQKRQKEPRLFVPFRALGLITNHVPFVLQTRSFKGAVDGPQIHILTCLGRSWALWEGGKMTLLFVGPEADDQITSMAMDGDAVWAAAGKSSMKYIRGKEILRLENPYETEISFITIFGSKLLALTDDGTKMLIWNTSNGALQTSLSFETGFIATSILHPATYVNKVLVSSAQGGMQLWNIHSKTCIHKFQASNLIGNSPPCPITATVQSPAIDVVGLGFRSGDIVIQDVRTDERMMRMFMDGGVRALGFRSDGEAILASSSPSGDLAIWDLNAGGRLLHMVRGAHIGAITALEWVPGQPVLVTSGEDNSVKQWIFDSPTAAPRLLKFRSGHQAPPHLICHYGEDGKQLLTASRDRSLRCTSVVRDSRSFELSQGSLARKAASMSLSLASLKFPPVTSLSYSTSRSKDWDDILTSHQDETFARTWHLQNKRLGQHTLGFKDDFKAAADSRKKRALGSVKAVCVTSCGTFGLAGSSNGVIHMWNMQSGIKRRSFDVGPCPPDVAVRFRNTNKKSAADRCITGIATDSLNTVVIASTLDGTTNFFDFYTAKLEHALVLPSSAVSILLSRDNGLLAVSSDDMIIRIIDIETRRIVRELGGFKGRILDMTFSADCRWLVTTSLDSVIRTFDIPTGRLIDAFRTSSSATSMSLSPTNDFLATSHVDSVGIFLWANRAQYDDVSFQTVSEDDIADASMPSMQGVDEDEALEAMSPLKSQQQTADVFSTPSQLDSELVTLTLLPRSRWQTLINLEVIQQRNKPKEPPKAPEKAPFFLPTLPGVETRFEVAVKRAEADKKPTRRIEQAAARSESVFLKNLTAEPPDSKYEAFFAYIKTLSPAAIDIELRSLVSLDSLQTFINALTRRLSSHRDFEAIQAFLKVFLNIHAEVIIENAELSMALQQLLEVEKAESERVLELVASSLGTLGFIRATVRGQTKNSVRSLIISRDRRFV